MLDFLTVVFDAELEFLKTQAKSFHLYAPDSVRTIWVVVNDNDSVAEKIDTAWWGGFAPKVRIVTRDYLKVPNYGTGWDSQQLCKLVAASRSQQIYCIVFDAKTWLVRELVPSDLFDGNGINIELQQIQPAFQDGWNFLVNEFGLKDPKQQLGPAGVPYIFRTDHIRELFTWVMSKYNQTFIEWYSKHSMYPTLITEFLTYSAWVYKSEGGYHSVSNNQPWQPVNIGRGEGFIFDEKFAEMSLPSTLTVSIHRDAYNELSETQKSQWATFLKEKRLD